VDGVDFSIRRDDVCVAESIERSFACGEILTMMIPALGGVHRHNVLLFLMINQVLLSTPQSPFRSVSFQELQPIINVINVHTCAIGSSAPFSPNAAYHILGIRTQALSQASTAL
jgi:hypothetical protein